MSVICREHAESRCDCYPHNCYGCNAFVNPTNFDRIKYDIRMMNIGDFIEFCGGKSCNNIICKYIPLKNGHCYSNDDYDCGKCIVEYLKSKPLNDNCDDCKYYMWGSCLHKNAANCNHSELWTPIGFGDFEISMFNLPHDIKDMVEMGVYTEEEVVNFIRKHE